MSDDLKDLTAIAWTMRKPPYISGGGRAMKPRHCYIMVLDTYLVLGFETDGQPARYRVFSYATVKAAQKGALSVTVKREAEGFILDDEPHSAVATGGKRSKLTALVGKNEPNADMHASIMHVISKGTALAEQVA